MTATTTQTRYRHVEAFCHMKYATDDGSETEWIYNSRDGVTPFVITSRSGKEMKHVDWQLDRREPEYRPKPGERIFVDLTREKAEEYARYLVEKHWSRPEYPMSDRWPTKEEAIADLAADMMEQPGQPDLVEVMVALPAESTREQANKDWARLFAAPVLSANGKILTGQAFGDEERRLAKLRAKRRAARKCRQKGQRRG